MSVNDRHFDIDASIVFQLGAGLISDSVQALVELIKNCWDADSTYARITINTKDAPPDTRYFANERGYILIEDDGVGMNESDLINGWLLISNSMKREQKAKHQKTTRDRTPLGEKGLGRLGVQRLGDNIEIVTKASDSSQQYNVGWTWNDFRGKKRLSQLSPNWYASTTNGSHGTKLLITGLLDREAWEQQETLDRFKVRLSQMISPYAKFPEFKITARVNNKRLELAEISEKIRSLATLRYVVDYDGERMDIAGRMQLNYLRPQLRQKNAEEEQFYFDELVGSDNGEAFFNYLLSQRAATRFHLTRDTTPGSFCNYRTSYFLNELDKAETGSHHLSHAFSAANPGPFHAEIDSFNLEEDDRSVFAGNQEYKAYVKEFGGVRIFRDGFGVRTDEDWLGLGRAFTRGGSFYALRPANVMGFVAITAEHNQSLLEATDREGFIDTAAYRNFVLLFQTFARFAGEAQEFVRRGYHAFKGQTARKRAEVSETASPEEVARALVSNLSRSQELSTQVQRLASDSVGAATREAASLVTALRPNVTATEVTQIKSRVVRLQRVIESTGEQLLGVQGSLIELSKSTDQAKLLQQQVETLRYQMREASSTISLGLTAEALSHEIANVADRLAEKTNDVSKYLSRSKVADARVIGFAEHVRSTVNALRKQMAHLAPSLRFARERRSRIEIGTFLDNLCSYHNDRWTDGEIRMIVQKGKKSFNVRMNEGKLTQAIDNLVINSEYWLKEAIRKGDISRGEINVNADRPYLRVSDNGPGISSHVEPMLFQPFSTSRKNGRGLGLFIVRQLLEADNCSIAVSPKRNPAGRLFEFTLDLSGVVDDE